MIFKIYYKVLGGHTHCRFFAGRNEGSLGKCGDLVLRNEEFEVFKTIMMGKDINFEKNHPPIFLKDT